MSDVYYNHLLHPLVNGYFETLTEVHKVLEENRRGNGLRRRSPWSGNEWYLDEVFIRTNGTLHYLWRGST